MTAGRTIIAVFCPDPECGHVGYVRDAETVGAAMKRAWPSFRCSACGERATQARGDVRLIWETDEPPRRG